MRWMKRKLFFIIMLVASLITPRELGRYVREIKDEADMNGFFDGYRAGVAEAAREYGRKMN